MHSSTPRSSLNEVNVLRTHSAERLDPYKKRRHSQVPASVEMEQSRKKQKVEKAEVEPMEKHPIPTLEQVKRMSPRDYDQFGLSPLREEEEETGIDDFFKKMNRFNTLLRQWQTMPDYDPDLNVDLPWLEERLGAKTPPKPKPKREEVSDEQVDADFYEDCAKGFFKRMARFNELMEQWKTMPDYEPNRKADLTWLEENVAPRLQPVCPFHPLGPLMILNPEAENEPWYYKCQDCPVWCSSNTVDIVLPELKANIHPEVRAKLEELTCRCDLRPRMKLSQSAKNPLKVFLTCGQNPREKDPCGYFQWMHGPLWRPKTKPQPLALDRWRATEGRKRVLDNWRKTSVGEYFDQKITVGSKRQYPPAWRTPTEEPPQKKPFAGGFKPPVFGETPQPVKSFEELCDEQNAERMKYNCAPYSYETYRRYGLGIF